MTATTHYNPSKIAVALAYRRTLCEHRLNELEELPRRQHREPHEHERRERDRLADEITELEAAITAELEGHGDSVAPTPPLDGHTARARIEAGADHGHARRGDDIGAWAREPYGYRVAPGGDVRARWSAPWSRLGAPGERRRGRPARAGRVRRVGQ